MVEENKKNKNTEKENHKGNNKKPGKSDKKPKKNLMRSRLHGHTAFYFKLPLYFVILIFPIVAWTYSNDVQAGFVLSIALALYILFAIGFYYYSRNKYLQELVDFAMDYTQVQKKLIKGLELPYGRS